MLPSLMRERQGVKLSFSAFLPRACQKSSLPDNILHNASRSGGIGRHTGLKILCEFLACGFNSRLRHRPSAVQRSSGARLIYPSKLSFGLSMGSAGCLRGPGSRMTQRIWSVVRRLYLLKVASSEIRMPDSRKTIRTGRIQSGTALSRASISS